MKTSVTDISSFKKQEISLQSTVAFFFKAAWVKNNWFWQYKVFSIIILQTAKIDPSGFFHLRLYSAFPMLLGVAAQCHMRSRGSIQKPEEVVQNHNGCLKKMSGFVGLLLVLVFFRVVFGLVLGFLFCFYLKCSVLSLSFEVRKLFRGSLATFTSFLLNQTVWAHPRRGESWESPWLLVRVPRAPETTGGLPGAGENVHPGVPQHCNHAAPCKWLVDRRYPSWLKSWNVVRGAQCATRCDAAQRCSSLRHGRRWGAGSLALWLWIRSTEKLGITEKASEL